MIAPTLVQIVRQRAQGICEYCHLPEAVAETPFQLEHIIAEQHGGMTEESNLAWSCLYCNKVKGPNVAGIDPVTGQLMRLFNPRVDRWSEHFRWDGVELVGITAIGRVTVVVLGINRPHVVARRATLIAEGRYPTA